MTDAGPSRPLQKWLMRAGAGSKNEVRQWIQAGRVRVDGAVITRFAHPIYPGQQVEVNDIVVPPPDPARQVWLMNKPKKHLTQREDQKERWGLKRYLPEEPPRLFPVGRLDYNSEGALLWTDDGELARRVLHPDHHLPKRYHVKIRGHLEEDAPGLVRMRAGIELGDFFSQPRSVRWLVQRTRATWVEIVLTEGKNRQIRRMCSACGYQIVKLRRVAIGPIALGELNPRCIRPLTVAERNALYQAVNLEADSVQDSV